MFLGAKVGLSWRGQSSRKEKMALVKIVSTWMAMYDVASSGWLGFSFCL
jgi:hypothetical protein